MAALIGSLFYATGAVYGTASGILESTLPEPSDYVPRVLQVSLLHKQDPGGVSSLHYYTVLALAIAVHALGRSEYVL